MTIKASPRRVLTTMVACVLATFSVPARARAADETVPAAPQPEPETPPALLTDPETPPPRTDAEPTPPAPRPVVPLPAPQSDAEQPQPAQLDFAPRLKESEHFTIDPVVDGVLIAGGFTFSELLSLILSTGEIRPQLPVSTANLLSIDRVAVTQTIDPNAGSISNFGLWAAYAYAVIDPVMSGVRDGRNAFFVDAVMYAETIAITQTFTDATKIAVRRPRPIDYANCAVPNPPADQCSITDLQLSFFSGHASETASVAATATYLAFTRSGPHTLRPWLTLAIGTAVTALVSYERVRSGEHFPTDVIMGSLAGAGIGILVPHFHRRPHYHEKQLESTPVIIGYAPNSVGGHSLTLQWKF